MSGPPDIFRSGVPDAEADPDYLTLRDSRHPMEESARARVREMWATFHGEGLAEKGFEKNFARRLLDRYWEMHLACALLGHGIALKRQVRDGPDFYADHDGHRVWVEARVMWEGDGANRVPPMESSGKVPVDPVRARIWQGLIQKRRKWKGFLNKDIVSPDDSYVLGLNLKRTLYSNMGEPSVLARALFGVSVLWHLNPQTQSARETYPDASTIVIDGRRVEMKPFRDPSYSWVTAVIGSTVDPSNVWYGLSGEFEVVRNPMAKPLPSGFLPGESKDPPQESAEADLPFH